MNEYEWRAIGALIAFVLVGSVVGICLLAGMQL